ncbi:MAG: serine hydrolase [Chitinophagales bacterium]
MRSKHSILAGLLLLLPLLVSAQTWKEQEIIVFTDSLLHATYSDTEPGAAVLIARNGKVVHAQGYGLASLELGVANEPDNLFDIGSMSKQFTAVAILQLVDKGLADLDTDVRTYIPEYNTHDHTITLRHLLTHTSGITSFTELDTFATLYNKDMGREEIMDLFMEPELLFTPDNDWSYSNSGFTLAGMIVEKISGQSFPEYMQEHIFQPAGMQHTYIGNLNQVFPKKVSGYSPGEYGWIPAREFSWDWPFAAGAIISSVEDLLLWDEALYSDKLVSQKTLQQAFEPHLLADGTNTNYGFGWGVSVYKELTFIRHGGAINGFLSDAVRIPEAHFFMVILSNNQSVGPAGLTDEILNKAFSLGIANTTEQSCEDYAEELTGVYQVVRSGGRLVTNYSEEPVYGYVRYADGALTIQQTGGGTRTLTCIGKDTFMLRSPYTRMVFTRDENDRVLGMHLLTLPTTFGPDDFAPKTDIPLPGEKKEVSLLPEQLIRLCGSYDLGGGFLLSVTAEGSQLFIQATGQAKFPVYPTSDTEFFWKIVDASVTFETNEDGSISGITLHQGGDYFGRKIN